MRVLVFLFGGVSRYFRAHELSFMKEKKKRWSLVEKNSTQKMRENFNALADDDHDEEKKKKKRRKK